MAEAFGDICDEIIPRLKSRGPIEAPQSATVPGPDSTIPRLKSRGPIEASIILWFFFTFLLIPRLKSRGPIEAMDRVGMIQWLIPFRG